VPGIDPARLAELFKSQSGGLLDMINMFSGGAVSRFSIFALGIMPYISASIIMQLMTVVSPTLGWRRSRPWASPSGSRASWRSTPARCSASPR
jgi:preprotein translocase subunit SecY